MTPLVPPPREVKTLSQLESVALEIREEKKIVKDAIICRVSATVAYLVFSGVMGHQCAKGNCNVGEFVACELTALGVYGAARYFFSTKKTQEKIHNLQAASGKYLLANAYPVHPDLPAALNMDTDAAIAAALEMEREGDEKRTGWTLQAVKTAAVETLQHCTSAITALLS